MPNSSQRTWAALVFAACAAQPNLASADLAPTAPGSAVVREAERRMDVIEKNRALIEELVGMGAMDQLLRDRWLDLRKDANEATRTALLDVWNRRIQPIDEAHVRRIKELLAARSEWFRLSEVGRQAELAAFVIVQHADDLALQKAALVKMELLLASGDIEKSEYAMLWDRVAIQEGRPQLYATQGTDCDGGQVRRPPRPGGPGRAGRPPQGDGP